MSKFFLIAVSAFISLGAYAVPPPSSVEGANVRIIGGEDAKKGEFPFMVAIIDTSLVLPQLSCGGTIINRYTILTAAHCVDGVDKETLSIRAGIVKLKDLTFPPEVPQTRDVKEIIIHELFNGNLGTTPDIALLVLSSPLIFNEKVQPVSLESQEPGVFNSIRPKDDIGNMTVIGWGRINRDGPNELPNTLQKVQLPVTPIDVCQTVYPGVPLIGTGSFCAGSHDAPRAPCNGDSGGPIFYQQDNQFIQTGIVSWGVRPCGSKGFYDVYTNLAHYLGWIRQQVVTSLKGETFAVDLNWKSGFNVRHSDDSLFEKSWRYVSKGHTPSSYTGPSKGLGTGGYAYFETSRGKWRGANKAGESAVLESPYFVSYKNNWLGYGTRLSFSYHMYGRDIGELAVDVYQDGNWIQLWSIWGEEHDGHSSAWTTQMVSLGRYAGLVKVRFRATAVGGYRGDIAVDNVKTYYSGPPLLDPVVRHSKKMVDETGHTQSLWGSDGAAEQYCNFYGYNLESWSSSCGGRNTDYLDYSNGRYVVRKSGSANQCYEIINTIRCRHGVLPE